MRGHSDGQSLLGCHVLLRFLQAALLPPTSLLPSTASPFWPVSVLAFRATNGALTAVMTLAL